MTITATSPRPVDYDRERRNLEMLQIRLVELGDWIEGKMHRAPPKARAALECARDHIADALADCNYELERMDDDTR